MKKIKGAINGERAILVNELMHAIDDWRRIRGQIKVLEDLMKPSDKR